MTTNAPRGYTLLELIVSLAIFSMVMVIVTGAYLMLINLDREVRATNQTVSTLSFTVDSMARSIRTGSNYSCESGGINNCKQFTFTDSSGQTQHYCRKTDNTIGQYTTGNCTTATSITDPSITIDTLTFVLVGVGASDNVQPQVIFTMHGTMPTGAAGTGASKKAEFTIQTSATERLLEI